MRRGGIWHVSLLIILASLIAGILHLAALALIVWGMIFRPCQTIGTITVFFVFGLISQNPWVSVLILGLLLALNALHRRDEASGDECTRQLEPPNGGM